MAEEKKKSGWIKQVPAQTIAKKVFAPKAGKGHLQPLLPQTGQKEPSMKNIAGNYPDFLGQRKDKSKELRWF